MPLRIAPAVTLDELQAGDTVTIQDGKEQELTGKVRFEASRLFIEAFGFEIVIARWVPSRIDPGMGVWDSKYKITDWVAPLPL